MKRFLLMVTLILLLAFAAACSSDSATNSEGDSSSNKSSQDSSSISDSSSSESSSESSEPEEWAPEGELEFMASYSPGGGHDQMLRTMAKIFVDEGIIENPITVVNKPGGSGAVGMAYTATKESSDNYLMSVTSTFLTTPMQGNTANTYEDFTPIARLGLDPYVILVNADSGIENWDQFEEFLRNNDATFGGTAVGGGEHIFALELEEAMGIELEYLPFEGDGEVVTSLLGGHIDVMANNIGSAIEYVANGDMIPIVVSTPERLEEFPDVPTVIESGYDVEWQLYRGVYGPAGMSEEAAKWFEGKIKKLTETQVFQEQYFDKYMVKPGFMTGDEFKAYLDGLVDVYEENLRELGILE